MNSIFLEKIVLEKVGSAKFNKGTTAKLNCKMAKGSRPYEVRWTKQGLGSNLPPRMKVEDTKLIINNVKMDDSGVYSCYINNSISNGSLSFDIHIYSKFFLTFHLYMIVKGCIIAFCMK